LEGNHPYKGRQNEKENQSFQGMGKNKVIGVLEMKQSAIEERRS
jgi:hypothetical protein